MQSLLRRMLEYVKQTAPREPKPPAGRTTADDFGRESQEIWALQNRLLDAIKEKMLPELLDMMTDDVVLLTASGPPTVGRDAVKALCTDLFSRFDIRHHCEVTTGPRIGNVIMSAGGHLLTLRPLDGGDPVTTRGRTMKVFRLENGAWKLSRILLWANWVEPTLERECVEAYPRK